MAKRPKSAVTGAYRAGLKAGVRDAFSGAKYGAGPVRLRKSVGSPVTDREARYADVHDFKQDVQRAKHVVIHE